MIFGLSAEVSEPVIKLSVIITELSRKLEIFLQDKRFGQDIIEFYIGIICVAPEFDFFFTRREKYSKTKKSLTYDIKLDYERVIRSSDDENRNYVISSIIDSLSIIDNIGIKDFCVEDLKILIREFANK